MLRLIKFNVIKGTVMNKLIYIVGLVVVVGAILSYLGMR